MNNEKRFAKPEAEIVAFDIEDIILTSDFEEESENI